VKPHVAVIHYSATGHVHRLAEAVAKGARSEGAEVRLRRVAELAPPAAVAANSAWAAHCAAVADLPAASHDDLRWGDAYAFGTPSRFGTPAAQLKQFLDTTGRLWSEGVLSDKPVTVFTSADNPHGGLEATLLSLSNVFYHWGSVLVPPGYTDAAIGAAGGNPYGASFVSKGNGADLTSVLWAAHYQGARLARYARAVRVLRSHDALVGA
jgi:NAD(P)H dehydrogenase (quinone)